jgi:hypothetical protein
MGNLRRMSAVGTASLIDGFEPFEPFECHTGFERCTVLFPLCLQLPSPYGPLPTQPCYLNDLSSFRGTLDTSSYLIRDRAPTKGSRR